MVWSAELKALGICCVVGMDGRLGEGMVVMIVPVVAGMICGGVSTRALSSVWSVIGL